VRARTIVFAGGGTAGHIQPALAVAALWQQNNRTDRIIFIGTQSGLETTLVPQAGFELKLITRVRVPRSLSPALLKVPTLLHQAIAESKQILTGADLLVGFGGYVCAPAYIAARSLHIPIVIHEANAKPGWANRLGARYTDALAVGTPAEKGAFSDALIAGLPLREDVSTILQKNANATDGQWSQLRESAKTFFGIDPAKKVILVFGGSQGSQAINSVIESARSGLKNSSIVILHSVGGANALPASDDHYKAFAYINDMAQAYLAADLVIARSGAITCSEVGALAKFALFIPLPVGNGEQSVNADHLVAAGRAITLEQKSFNSSWLIDNMDSMLTRSSQQSDGVYVHDLDAAAKIVALAEHQLELSAR
jgi:UDP-N-acetylglucosamine--N-acetylmuramyl-(pentapeptide) pyrophosphoryl-undecaprenol N-acetylglucosamine transferase